MGKRIVVKVGSNVLTREDGKLDVTRMSAIVDQIVWLRKHDYEVILVSSGAVAAEQNCTLTIIWTAWSNASCSLPSDR